MSTPGNDSITFVDGPFGWHIPRWPVHYSWVYLYHFSEKYHHAGHYLGSTCNLDGRLLLHQHGHGARLTQVVVESGRCLELARLWCCDSNEEARMLEHKLKRTHGHGPALCPICRGKPVDVYTALRQGHWPLGIHDRHGRRQPTGEPQFTRG